MLLCFCFSTEKTLKKRFFLHIISESVSLAISKYLLKVNLLRLKWYDTQKISVIFYSFYSKWLISLHHRLCLCSVVLFVLLIFLGAFFFAFAQYSASLYVHLIAYNSFSCKSKSFHRIRIFNKSNLFLWFFWIFIFLMKR